MHMRAKRGHAAARSHRNSEKEFVCDHWYNDTETMALVKCLVPGQFMVHMQEGTGKTF